jgi:probable phosphoglycerate mutase
LKKTFFIFRHGETDWNRDQRIQGQSDIPLNSIGRQQALKLQEFFVREPVEIFLSSDLDRAQETARIAKGQSAVSVVIDTGLRETHLGAAEGLTRDQIAAQLGEDVWKNWNDSSGPKNSDHRFPGGESKNEHLSRVRGAIERFAKETVHSRVGVSTHGGAMRRLIHHFIPGLKDHAMIPNCAVYRLDYDSELESWTLGKEPVFVPS